MRYHWILMLLAILLLLQPVPAAAQDIPTQVYEVPTSGYHGNDTYFPEDQWNEYRVHVPKGHELEYSFQVRDQGQFRLYLIPEIGTEYVMQGSYYISYSSDEPVESYSATFPADYGFAQEYTLVLNSTSTQPVNYSVSIQIIEIEAPDYTIHYVLIGLGVVGVVAFSWYYVNWQVRQERRAQEKAKVERRSRRGKRRR